MNKSYDMKKSRKIQLQLVEVTNIESALTFKDYALLYCIVQTFSN